MKNNFISIILLGTALITSCQKEALRPDAKNKAESFETRSQQISSSNEFHVTVKGNVLVFPTRADYEKVVNDPGEGIRSSFLETIKTLKGFAPYTKNRNAHYGSSLDLLKDSYFGSMLNEDLAIQIGTTIFKIDPLKEKVYVLPAAEENHYADLIQENTAYPGIQVYSTNDNVLDLIDKVGTKGLFCSETGINRKGDSKFFKGTYLYASYSKWGVYFSLRAYIPTGSVNTYHFDVNPCYYHVRCGKTVGPYQAANNPGSYDFLLQCQEYQSYQGSTNLNELFFRVKIRDNSTSPPTYSENVELRANY
jgi:hypothetical protein